MILFIKHIPVEGPGVIGGYFRERGYDLKYVELSRGESLPEKLDNIEAVVSLGGPMNVYEEEKYPFLRDEDKFIKKVLKKNIPFLGICLGSQLLAKAAGARVMRAAREEIGFYEIGLTGSGNACDLFKGMKNKIEVFQWHGDTFSIPEDGMLLAMSDLMENQALRVGDNAYGLQFHLEVDGGIIKDWFSEYSGSSSWKIKDTMGRYEAIKDEFSRNAGTICRNFEGIITTRKSKD